MKDFLSKVVAIFTLQVAAVITATYDLTLVEKFIVVVVTFISMNTLLFKD